MTSPQPETETHEVTLSRDEQWAVHAHLASIVDEALENDETPPTWALDLFDAVEDGDGTTVLTGSQARRLSDAMTSYVDCEESPDRDVIHGSNVVNRLEDCLESEPTQ
ncbi:hypothetical protein GS429_15655 [Natronorubrum sp. JWXQ-INN-674]|uniref:Uncharacterized protein n=1 Tax=Natronorubrum halalkaliphilum TaxID=2691917 RepID=A0A6B0VPS4_9EURY|nr:hypothetical protein [Natronorubrum halalkaliphilum]MXV63464.1 hypothetical protein [Natronorubrum halalkaliphilum]